MKAKFIKKYYGCKRSYDEEMVYLEYEYRGRIYTISENRRLGNEPLSWQHNVEQSHIDEEIRREEILAKSHIDEEIRREEILAKTPHEKSENAEVGFNAFLEYLETGEESIFN